MRILLRKLSDERHVLQIIRDDGRSEEVECETRSYLHHDLLHYAAEAEARTGEGFWGNLAKGKTLPEMNDRTGKAMQAEGPQMAAIEQVVGALSSIAKGVAGDVFLARFHDYAENVGIATPEWLTPVFVSGVEERMRRLLGRWKATPFGEAMTLRVAAVIPHEQRRPIPLTNGRPSRWQRYRA